MITRKQAEAIIEYQMEAGPFFTDKFQLTGMYHYGWMELRELLDAIYEPREQTENNP